MPLRNFVYHRYQSQGLYHTDYAYGMEKNTKNYALFKFIEFWHCFYISYNDKYKYPNFI